MTSNETSKELALPAAQQVVMAELARIMAEIKPLHQLLDLLQKTDTPARQLADTLREMASELGDIGIQLAQMKKAATEQQKEAAALRKQVDRIEEMMGVILDVKEGKGGF